LPAEVTGVTVDMATITGEEPEPVPQQLQPFIQGTPEPDEDTEDEQEPTEQAEPKNPALAEEMAKWQRKALKALKAGKSAAVDFESDVIPPALAAEIAEALKNTGTADGVKAIFAKPGRRPQNDDMLLAELRRANDLLERARKGAPEGHEFYGNQWTGGGGAGGGGNPMSGKGQNKNLAGGWRSKYHDTFADKYDIGARARADGITNFKQAVDDPKYRKEIMNMDDDDLNFFSAGLRGSEMPYPVVGWRYGEIPSDGRSTNFVEQTKEPGVSMMEVPGVGETQDKISAMFISAKNRPVTYVRGYLNTYRKGSDGEPLIMFPHKITSDQYKEVAGGQPDIQK
jgi:hypothetical protein